MKKKLKLFASLASLCLSIAVLCFGVFAALRVDYSLSGSVSYTAKDVFVNIKTSLYRSTSDSVTTENGVVSTLAAFKNTAQTLEEVATQTSTQAVPGFSAEDVYSYDVETGSVVNPGTSLEGGVDNIPIKYGKYTAEGDTAYAYYIVITIQNYGQAAINATVTNATSADINSIQKQSAGLVNIAGRTTQNPVEVRVVIGLALLDVTKAVNGEFEYEIVVSPGEVENVDFNTEEQTITLGDVRVNDTSTETHTDVSLNEAVGLSLSNVSLTAGEDAQVSLELTSADATNYTKVKLTYPNGLPAGVQVNTPSLFLPKTADEKTYTITITNTTNSAINLSDLFVNVEVEKVSSLLQTADEGYQYVEMGTIATETANEYVRWRLIKDDETSEDVMKGHYILETDTQSAIINKLNSMTSAQIQEYVANGNDLGTMVAYNLDTANGNDYKTSNIRKYLNYTGSNVVAKNAIAGAQASNFVTDLNIDIENDLVYAQITKRTLEDLYTNIDAQGNTKEVPAGEDTLEDKFWLLSYSEVLNLLCNGAWDNTKADYSTQNHTSFYWLRSGYTELPNGACVIHSDGSYGYNEVTNAYVSARAGFVIG